jgi:uncharacterized membrane protein YraQ (UPF0718 family)
VKAKPIGALAVVGAYVVFLAVSFASGFEPGRQMGAHFVNFLLGMLRVLPCVFVLIGLFEVWVKRETVERHLGHGSGPLGLVWAVLLAGTIVGGMHIALPVAHTLYRKGARLQAVLAYLSAAAICRVPMTLFEASFLGWKFTLVRLFVSLPLVLVASAALGAYLDRTGYTLPDDLGN